MRGEQLGPASPDRRRRCSAAVPAANCFFPRSDKLIVPGTCEEIEFGPIINRVRY
jgi:hypothetical protein